MNTTKTQPTSSTASGPATTPFGTRLRHWRKARHLSQMALSHRANVTPRHLSFLETGRSRPGEEMVLRLAEALALPLREQNAMLRAAGFAPIWDEAPLRALVGRMLAQHMPFPALVLDGEWRVVDANPAAAMLLLGGAQLPTSLCEVMLSEATRALIVNWEEVARAGILRLRNELDMRPSATLERQLARLEAAVGDAPARTPAGQDTSAHPVIVARAALGDEVVETLTTIVRFQSPRSVTADELQVELVYPADAQSDAVLRAAASALRMP